MAQRRRGMQPAERAIFAGLPLTLSAIADITGGMTTDAMARRRRSQGLVRRGRRLVPAGRAGTLSPGAHFAGVPIAMAGALSMFTLAPNWATAIGVGGSNAALIGGDEYRRTGGRVPGPIALAYVVNRPGDRDLPLHVLSDLYLVAAIAWMFIRPGASAR